MLFFTCTDLVCSSTILFGAYIPSPLLPHVVDVARWRFVLTIIFLCLHREERWSGMGVGSQPYVNIDVFLDKCLQLSNFMTIFYVHSLYMMGNPRSYQVIVHDLGLPVSFPPLSLRLENALSRKAA